MAYLKLFHGRESPDAKIDGWGEEGPIFGPFPYFHTTYGREIVFHQEEAWTLPIIEDFVFYDGMYYGDWSVYDGPVEESDRDRMAEFLPALALFTLETDTHQAGIVSLDVLWLDLVAAHIGDHHSTVASMASALLEWVDLGGTPPEISLRVKSLPWLPADAVAAPVTVAVCEALRSLARNKLENSRKHSGSEVPPTE